jgi:hypothetical protein
MPDVPAAMFRGLGGSNWVSVGHCCQLLGHLELWPANLVPGWPAKIDLDGPRILGRGEWLRHGEPCHIPSAVEPQHPRVRVRRLQKPVGML